MTLAGTLTDGRRGGGRVMPNAGPWGWIGHYDLLIAAQALRGRATLVTGNVREFARVKGLVMEDWTAEG